MRQGSNLESQCEALGLIESRSQSESRKHDKTELKDGHLVWHVALL